ncbi:MAG TPA: hypothetical protein VKT78_08705 [Fimbriimonadaceae bacterium]|nr:hypothetical protein [Fimbriimonadaceae bacterium]
MNTKFVPLVVTALMGVAATGGTHIARYGGSAEVVGLVKSGGKGVAQAVVSIQDVPGSYHASGSPVKMDQRDKEFLPHVLAIMKGTTVRFDNSDPYFHNVFSSSHVQTFNVSQEKRGDSSDIKFDHAGIIPIKCHIHANMKAYIIVLANPFFSKTSSTGLFRIEGVPAGTYTLKVWSEAGSTTQQITVPASGQAKTIVNL